MSFLLFFKQFRFFLLRKNKIFENLFYTLLFIKLSAI